MGGGKIVDALAPWCRLQEAADGGQGRRGGLCHLDGLGHAGYRSTRILNANTMQLTACKYVQPFQRYIAKSAAAG